jgi:hypothetical protein
MPPSQAPGASGGNGAPPWNDILLFTTALAEASNVKPAARALLDVLEVPAEGVTSLQRGANGTRSQARGGVRRGRRCPLGHALSVSTDSHSN